MMTTQNGSGEQLPGMLLTRKEVAERLRLHERSVQRLLVSGELPAVRWGRRVRVDPADLVAFIEKRKTGPNRAA